ncbi:MAG: FAD-binding oxidoreductase, partial [Candidatus Omnitrophica bacterium]|nr:FAD-binding oxidoreductase [Candidatus Omnitrophota bacterium]
MYRKIENKDIQRLGDIVGKDFVLTDEVAKQTYSHDETPDLKAEPEVIVKPADSKQISEIMQLATAEKLPITPRGGGTGLSGGAVPVMGGIVLTTERMNKLLDLDKFNSMAVVEAGLINANLQTEAEKSGLFYPVNPASMDTCTLGGNVAEAAGGANAVRYGTTRNYVTGLEVVLPDGAETKAGGKILKNATDNDLVHLILGSEGTLAVITRIIMRLVPKPGHTVMLIIPFDEVEPISETVQAIFAKRITPTMVELMDRKTLKACEKFLGETIQYSDAGCQLIIRLDSDSADENTKLYEIIGEICLEHGAEDVLVAEDNTSLERIWKMRRSIHESLVKEAGLLA